MLRTWRAAAGYCPVELPNAEADGWLARADRPEWAVGFADAIVRRRCRERGFAVAESVRYGAWRERASPCRFQDIVPAIKPPSP